MSAPVRCIKTNVGRVISAAFFALLAIAMAPVAAQQTTISNASYSQADRDRMYAELHRDVDALERELSIYKRVVQLVSPSVVHVQATPLADYRFRRDVEEAGSGVLVRLGERDYVLTNRHVVKHSDSENIKLELYNGQQISPTQILTDPETDVAVLAVNAPGLVPARIGDSEKVEIGDPVMAFGNPFNLRQSVTRGIISGKGRANLDLGDGGVDYQNFMQTDAAINPGNSGGPLINIRGEVIGLNTAIASNSGGNDGIGFTIPINIAVNVMRQLIETGRVERGFLGVTLDGYFDARAAELAGLPRLIGARVKNVTGRSPAALAGLQVDDVILSFNGAQIENDQHLISLVKLSNVGRQVEMDVLRNGQYVRVNALIGRLEDFVDAVQQAAEPKR
jgi:serine protease Do